MNFQATLNNIDVLLGKEKFLREDEKDFLKKNFEQLIMELGKTKEFFEELRKVF